MAIVRFDSYKTLGFASISGAFAAVGTPISHNWRAITFFNGTDGDMIFSADGTNDNIFLPAGAFRLYDLSTNAVPTNVIDSLSIGIGTQIYVKQSTVPSYGAVYVEGFYARGE